MTLPYANIPQSVPFPAGVQSRPFSANDDYHYHTIPHNAPPQDPEPAYPRSHIEQPGTNNGSIMSLDPRAIMIHGPDAGIRWRRPFPTYKPRGAPDMRINLPRTLTWHQKMHLCPQPAAGQNPGYQPPTNSTWDQELENAGFPQAVHDKLWNFPQDLYKAQDGHGLGYDPNTTWPYMVRPYSVGASGPAPVRIYMVPSQNRSHNSLHWSGPSHPNLPGLGTGYVSLEGQKEFATDLRPEGQHFLGTPSPYHYVQMSYADRGVVEGASINGAQYAGDHGDRFHVPNELPHPLHSPVQDILNYPHGHNSANSDRQASSTPTLQLVKQDHNTANPIEETGRSEFTLEPRQVKTGRVRKPLTPQGRAEAAWNRTNGICDECRKKKVKCSHRLPSDLKLLYPEPGSKKRRKLSRSKGREQKPRPSTGSNLSLPSPDPSPSGSPNDVTSLGTSEPADKPERQLEIQRGVAGIGTPETPGSYNMPEWQLIIPRSVAGIGTPETPGLGSKVQAKLEIPWSAPTLRTNSNINGFPGDEYIPHDKAQSPVDDKKALENPPPISFNDGPLYLDAEEFDRLLD